MHQSSASRELRSSGSVAPVPVEPVLAATVPAATVPAATVPAATVPAVTVPAVTVPAAAVVGTAAAPQDMAAVARGGLANLIGAVVSILTNFVLTFIVARLVTPAVAGTFFAITSLFLIAQTLGRLGGDTGMVYFVARWQALGQPERIRPGLRTALTWLLAGCATVSLLVIVFAPELAHLLGATDGRSVWLLRLLALILPLATVNDVALGTTRGFGWMMPSVVIEKVSRPALQVLAVLAVLALGWDSLLGLAWALPYVGAFVAVVIATRRVIRARTPPSRPIRLRDVRALRREYWSFALPRAFAGVAQIVLQRLDIVLVAVISGPRDAAVYTAATRFLVVGQFMNQAVSAPIQPRLSATLSSGDHAGAQQLFRTSTCWVVLTNWPLFGAAISLAPLYVSVFGHGYSAGTPVVVVLAVALLVGTGCGLVDSVIIMAGRTSWNLATTVLALVVNVGFDLALIPKFGIMGAAVGWCASILAANVVPLALVWSKLRMHPFGAPTLQAAGLSAALYVVIPLVVGRLVGGDLAALTCVAVGTVVYVAVVWRQRDFFDLGGLLRAPRRRPTGAAGPA